MIRCDLHKLDLIGCEYFDMLMMEERRRSDYEIYVTDVLKGMAERVYNISGLDAALERYYDFTRRAEKPKEKTPEEKLEEIAASAGLKIK